VKPVGVFDSGVGGLSVLKAIRAELPAEDLIYVADSAYAPYGERTRELIEQRSVAITRFLVGRGVKAIVIACNTATAVVVQTLRATFPLPIVAMEPAVKPAALQTKTGVIGVLATSHTLSSAKFLDLVEQHGGSVRVLIQACPGWVEQVEAGALDGPDTKSLVERLVRPLLDQGADTLVLGCTHFPFLRPLIEGVVGPDVALIDPAVPVARELRRRLADAHLLAPARADEGEEFWSSSSPEAASAVMSQLWSRPVRVDALPDEVV
jgi:glutamate racemase